MVSEPHCTVYLMLKLITELLYNITYKRNYYWHAVHSKKCWVV